MTDQVEEVPDYLSMGGGDMLQALGTDAYKWATAFCQQNPSIPHDLMVGWFANAMMTMWDFTNSQITHSDSMLIDHISQLVRNRDFWIELGEDDDEVKP